jgi:hypothetical protein
MTMTTARADRENCATDGLMNSVCQTARTPAAPATTPAIITAPNLIAATR